MKAARRGSLPVEQFQKFIRSAFQNSKETVDANDEFHKDADLDSWLAALATSPSAVSHQRLIKNSHWRGVQRGIFTLCRREFLRDDEMAAMSQNLKKVLNSDLRKHVLEFCRHHLLRRAMQILSVSVDILENDSDADLIEKLKDTWNLFYKELLPQIELLLMPILKESEDKFHANILAAFRDVILLRTNVGHALACMPRGSVSGNVKQMLLILHYHRDSIPPNENYLQLENLVAMAVSPFLGYRGLYENYNPVPVVWSSNLICSESQEDKNKDLFLHRADYARAIRNKRTTEKRPIGRSPLASIKEYKSPDSESSDATSTRGRSHSCVQPDQQLEINGGDDILV